MSTQELSELSLKPPRVVWVRYCHRVMGESPSPPEVHDNPTRAVPVETL